MEAGRAWKFTSNNSVPLSRLTGADGFTDRGAAIQHIEDLRMATTPAALEKRRTHADTFREFLRKAPEFISKDEIVEELLGSAKGFNTKRDLDNRITQARAAGDISTQGKDRRMKNFRSQSVASDLPERRTNGGGAADFSALDKFVDDARDLAEDAVIDQSITRDQLLEGLLMVTAAFRAVKKSHAS